MSPGGDNSTPFPSTGKGRGWGGGTLRQDGAREASSSVRRSPSPSTLPQPATTPSSQPSPVEGEGFDRFAHDTRAAPKAITRARKLRSGATHTEQKLWAHLRKLRFRFRRQAPVGPYMVDFACHRACLVIEIDGGVHNLPEVAVRDLRRDEWLTTQGYSVLRVTTRQVEDDIEGVMAAIHSASPLPLDGEGGGDWGGGRLRQDTAQEASSNDLQSRSATTRNLPASTPTQPSPVEGEGSDNRPPLDLTHQGGRALWRARDQWVRDDET